MTRQALATALTVTAVGLTSGVSSARQAAPAPAERAATAAIAGRVVAADTGRPLPNATLELVSFEVMRVPKRAVTDAQGRFTFTELAAGRYQLQASADRYATLDFGNTRPFESGRPIDLRDGERFDRADFSLPRLGAIEGRLLDEFGDPAPNILVQVSRLQFAAGRRRLVPESSRIPVRPTDDRGQFRVFGLAPGDYYVTAVPGAFTGQNETGGFAATYYPGTTHAAQAKRVRVDVNQDALNVTFALVPAPMSRVSGTVVDANGRPVSQANLWLAPNDRAGVIDLTIARGIADRSGNFSFRNVPPGRYVVQAFGPPVGGGNLGRAPFGWVSIAPNGADLTGLVLRVATGTSARGRVVFEGSAPRPSTRDVGVTSRSIEFASSPLGGGPRPSVMNEDWTFELGNQFGTPVLQVRVAAPAWALKRITHGARDVTDVPIDLSREDVEGLEIVLTDRVTSIGGGVTDAGGRALASYNVVIFAADRGRWTFPSRSVTLARPNQEGRYVVRGLPPDQYRAIALPFVDGSEWQDPEFLDKMWYLATPLTLGDGEAKTVDLKLTPRP